VTAVGAFTVLGPTLTSITPNTGVRGSAVAVTLAGQDLTGATAVAAPGQANITVTNFVPVNSTTVTATINLATATAVGAHTIDVVTPDGTTNTVTFTVTGATLTSIAPTSGSRGTSVPITIMGTNLTGAVVQAVGQANITVTQGTVSATQVTATLNLAPGAVLGAHPITVATPAGSPTINFTVLGGTVAFSAPTPALTTGGASGTATRTGTITLTYSGANGPLTITGPPTAAKVGTVGGAFSIAAGGTCGTTVTSIPATGGTCTVVVQYVPGGSTATATGNVTVPNSGGNISTTANFNAN
jgi:hypothetical protein